MNTGSHCYVTKVKMEKTMEERLPLTCMFGSITQGKQVLFAQHALERLSFCNISVSALHIGNPWSQYSLRLKLIALLKLKRPPGI